MKHEQTVKTVIVLVVCALHAGLMTAAWRAAIPPEPVEVENLTMIDLNAGDGSDEAGLDGAPALGDAAPPPPPAPPKPKPKPEPVKKPEPPKPKPKAEPKRVEPPQVKAVVRDDKPADIRPPEPPKPKPKPEPQKPESKPEPKPEPHKPEPKPEPKKPEAKPESATPATNSERSSTANPSKPERPGNGDRPGRPDGHPNGNNGNNPNSSKPGNPPGRPDGNPDAQGDGSKNKRKNDGDGSPVRKPSGGIVDGGLLAPLKVKYPPQAENDGIEGRVKVRIVVEVNGSVSSAEVISSSGQPILDQACMRGAKVGRFKLKTDGGQPVRTAFVAPCNFTLTN
ncbi:MAG: energy transducer TonB [Conchiformibius sp.]|nr:energy transducer TonB [Conchiformibius sp.]